MTPMMAVRTLVQQHVDLRRKGPTLAEAQRRLRQQCMKQQWGLDLNLHLLLLDMDDLMDRPVLEAMAIHHLRVRRK